MHGNAAVPAERELFVPHRPRHVRDAVEAQDLGQERIALPADPQRSRGIRGVLVEGDIRVGEVQLRDHALIVGVGEIFEDFAFVQALEIDVHARLHMAADRGDAGIRYVEREESGEFMVFVAAARTSAIVQRERTVEPVRVRCGRVRRDRARIHVFRRFHGGRDLGGELIRVARLLHRGRFRCTIYRSRSRRGLHPLAAFGSESFPSVR